MPKKQAIVKRSNGNISITIENNLKANQNTVSSTKKYKRRRRPTGSSSSSTSEDILRGGVGGGKVLGGGGAPTFTTRPTVDVSYIRPPPQSYSIWNDTTVPNNVGVPYAQAQQMGLINTPQEGLPQQTTNPLFNYPIKEGLPVNEEIPEIPEGIPVEIPEVEAVNTPKGCLTPVPVMKAFSSV